MEAPGMDTLLWLENLEKEPEDEEESNDWPTPAEESF